MITLSMFKERLDATESLLLSSSRSLTDEERYLLTLLTTLSSKTLEQQTEYLEHVLTIFHETGIAEQQSFKLMIAVIDAADRLIATIRQHYIYETGTFGPAQMSYVAQVQSLHYLIIMVYDGFILHASKLSHNQLRIPYKQGWQRYLGAKVKPSNMLAVAIHQSLLRYQKLLEEEAVCYRKPSNYLWSKIHQLYYLAYQRQVAESDLSTYIATHQTSSIHQVYCQICLLHLLNVRAMRRPNILLIQRLLPEWAKHMIVTMDPVTETKVFVDLHSSSPPSYLTASSHINPYEEHHDCVFIELKPMCLYFNARNQAFIEEGSIGIEYSLLNMISMAISYRYLQPPLTLPTKYSIKHRAKLMTNFNGIHHYVSHSHNFADLIAIKELSKEERPLYDRFDKARDSNSVDVETLDDHDSLARYRTLHLMPKNDEQNKDGNTKDSACGFSTAAPHNLYIMSLILVYRPDSSIQPDWSIGLVRWLNLDTNVPKVEWQVLGHKLVACGLRLEGSATRNRHFVPAFILGQDEQLQTTSTLIVPPSYFEINDRVVVRIGNKQTLLRLGARLIKTEEFNQYEVVRL